MSRSPGMPAGYDQMANPHHDAPDPVAAVQGALSTGTPAPAGVGGLSGPNNVVYRSPTGQTPPLNTQQFTAQQATGGGPPGGAVQSALQQPTDEPDPAMMQLLLSKVLQ